MYVPACARCVQTCAITVQACAVQMQCSADLKRIFIQLKCFWVKRLRVGEGFTVCQRAYPDAACTLQQVSKDTMRSQGNPNFAVAMWESFLF